MTYHRTLAIGDIHGGLKALEQLLNRLQITAKDQLIFMGDYVDGWSESAQVIAYLINLSETIDCIFIKGNHDVWCEQWLATGVENRVWLFHGGAETIESYRNISTEEKQRHLEFFERMKLNHLDAQNRLFLHAGFTSMHGVDREVRKENFYFDRTLWEMALATSSFLKEEDLIYPQRLKHYHEIYIGHTPTLNYQETQPMNAINVWNVDTGAAFTGKLSALDIDTKEVYQSERVCALYPDEKGRNSTSFRLRNSKPSR